MAAGWPPQSAVERKKEMTALVVPPLACDGEAAAEVEAGLAIGEEVGEELGVGTARAGGRGGARVHVCRPVGVLSPLLLLTAMGGGGDGGGEH